MRINLTKRGFGVSGGLRGLRASIRPKKRLSVGASIPGTGIGWTKTLAKKAGKSKGAPMADDDVPEVNDDANTGVEDAEVVSPSFVTGSRNQKWDEMSMGKKALGCGCLVVVAGFVLFILLIIIGLIVGTDSSEDSKTTTTESSTTVITESVVPFVGTVVPTTESPTTAVPETAAPTTAAPVTAAPTTVPRTSAPTSPPTTAGSSSAYYANCDAAKAAGAAPLHRGDPGYRAGLDRDNDGIACEK